MHITRLYIDGFGIFHQREFTGLHKGFNLFFGPNEAGKSTLLAFIRYILFGFPDGRSSQNQYPPLAGGAHGGIIDLSTSSGPYGVERYKNRQKGKKELKDYSGSAIDYERFINKFEYENLYAIGLTELEQFSVLKKEELWTRLYAASLGPGIVSPFAVEKQLKIELDKLYKPRGKKPALSALLRELKDIDNRLRALAGNKDTYHEKVALRDQTDALRAELVTEKAKLEHRVRRYEILRTLWDDWHDFTDCQKQLSSLPQVNTFPVHGIQDLEKLNDKIDNYKDQKAQLEAKSQNRKQECEVLTIDASVLQQAAAIETIYQELGKYQSATEDDARLAAEHKASNQALSATLESLGKGWNIQRVKDFSPSLQIKETVRQFRVSLDDLIQDVIGNEARVKQQEEDLEKAKAKHSRLAKELKAAKQPAFTRFDKIRRIRGRLDRLHDLLSRHEHLKESMANKARQLKEKREELIEFKNDLADKEPVLPTFLCYLLPLASIVLSVLIYFKLLPASPFWIINASVIGITIFYYLVYRLQLRREQVRKEKLYTKITLLNQAVEDRQTEIDDLSFKEKDLRDKTAELAAPFKLTAPTSADLRKKARKLDEIEEYLRAYKDRQKELQTAEQACMEAEVSLSKAHASRIDSLEKRAAKQQEFQQFLMRIGLERELTPDGALEVLSTCREAKEKLNALHAVQERHKSLQNYLISFKARAKELTSACHMEETQDAHQDIIALYTSLAVNRAKQEKKNSLLQESREIANDLTSCTKSLQELLQGRNALFAKAGADNEQVFREKHAVYEQRKVLSEKLARLENTLKKTSGNIVSLTDLPSTYQQYSTDDLERAHREHKESLQQTEDKIADKNQEIGGLDTEIEALASSKEQSALFLQQEKLLAKKQKLLHRFLLLALTHKCINQTRKRFEREKQPPVIKKAERIFARISDKRYQRIIFPLGEATSDNPMVIEDAQGKTKNIETELSRGTAEQLYLSLRFGWIEEFAKKTEPMPVILDDIMVNFDDTRRANTYHYLMDLAQTQQVLFFTCHKEIAEKLSGLDNSVQAIKI